MSEKPGSVDGLSDNLFVLLRLERVPGEAGVLEALSLCCDTVKSSAIDRCCLQLLEGDSTSDSSSLRLEADFELLPLAGPSDRPDVVI
jgi:hypothetical protein